MTIKTKRFHCILVIKKSNPQSYKIIAADLCISSITFQIKTHDHFFFHCIIIKTLIEKYQIDKVIRYYQLIFAYELYSIVKLDIVQAMRGFKN